MRKKRGNKARGILKSHWFGVAGVLVGVAGVILAAFFYLSSQTERELVYAVNPVRATVVTAGQASELAVFHEGEPLGNVDVTAAQVAIWNAGKQSIREENILEDVVICTDPPVPILEVSIRQCSREVTGFTLVEAPESLASGKVPVSWHILEENDGASVQLIYVGTQEVDFRVEGVIEGLRGIKDVELSVEIKTPQEQIREQQGTRTIWGITALLYGLLAAFAFVAAFTFIRRPPWRNLMLVVAFIFLPMVGVTTWQYFSFSTRFWPPFGF